MARLYILEDGILGFECPGCGDGHQVFVRKDHPGWNWNGSMETPTFTPSILVRSGHYAPDRANPETCWCTYNKQHPEDPVSFTCHRCHSFVTDGFIQFLPDSSHHLSGKTVPLPDCWI